MLWNPHKVGIKCLAIPMCCLSILIWIVGLVQEIQLSAVLLHEQPDTS